MLIGIHGKARYGKDTIGQHLEAAYGYKAWSFAGPLWAGLAKLLDIHPALIEGDRKDEVIDWIGFSPRELIQELGTGWGRNTMRTDMWIRVLDQRLRRRYSAWPDRIDQLGIVITDVRFDNEANWIREHGGQIWHLARPDAPMVRQHVSEAGIQALDGEPLIHNDKHPGELIRMVDGLMRERVA